MNRMTRAGVITAFATTIGLAGSALAQQSSAGANPCGDAAGGGAAAGAGSTGTPVAIPGDDSATPGAADTTMPGNASALYPMEEVARPLQLPKGELEAGAGIPIMDGPNGSGGFSVGSWIGLDLRGDYGITDKIQAGIRIPLLFIKPDLTGGITSPGVPTLAVFGGVLVDGMYRINDMLSVHADVGDVRAAGIEVNGSDYPGYYTRSLEFGLRAGVSVKKRLLGGRLAVLADPALEFQLHAVPKSGADDPFFGLRIPVAALYQLRPALAAGIRTGIWTGKDFSLSAGDGATIPVFLEGQYTLMNGNLDLGADLGFASLATTGAKSTNAYSGLYDSVGHSLYLGIFGAWRTGGLE